VEVKLEVRATIVIVVQVPDEIENKEVYADQIGYDAVDLPAYAAGHSRIESITVQVDRV